MSFILADGIINATYLSVLNANAQGAPDGSIQQISGYAFIPDPSEPGQLDVYLEAGVPGECKRESTMLVCVCVCLCVCGCVCVCLCVCACVQLCARVSKKGSVGGHKPPKKRNSTQQKKKTTKVNTIFLLSRKPQLRCMQVCCKFNLTRFSLVSVCFKRQLRSGIITHTRHGLPSSRFRLDPTPGPGHVLRSVRLLRREHVDA